MNYVEERRLSVSDESTSEIDSSASEESTNTSVFQYEKLGRSCVQSSDKVAFIKSASKEVSSILDDWLPQKLGPLSRARFVNQARWDAVESAKAFFENQDVSRAKNEDLVRLGQQTSQQLWTSESYLENLRAESIVKEGWLYSSKGTKRWVTLSRDSLKWSAGRNLPTDNSIHLASIEEVLSENITVTLVCKDSKGFQALNLIQLMPPISIDQVIKLSARTVSEASAWQQALKGSVLNGKDRSAHGYFACIDKCTSGELMVVTLPICDDDTTSKERCVTWHVHEGQKVRKDDPICDVSLRYKGKLWAQNRTEPATLFASCDGTVKKIFCERVDRISGDQYVTQDKPLYALSIEPRWGQKFLYLPKVVPQDILSRSRRFPEPSSQESGTGWEMLKLSEDVARSYLLGHETKIPIKIPKNDFPKVKPFEIQTIDSRYSSAVLLAARSILSSQG